MCVFVRFSPKAANVVVSRSHTNTQLSLTHSFSFDMSVYRLFTHTASYTVLYSYPSLSTVQHFFVMLKLSTTSPLRSHNGLSRCNQWPKQHHLERTDKLPKSAWRAKIKNLKSQTPSSHQQLHAHHSCSCTLETAKESISHTSCRIPPNVTLALKRRRAYKLCHTYTH